MTRRVKRTQYFELVLEIGDERFLETPRESQRNWLLNRVMIEAGEELQHLDDISKDFVTGSDAVVGLHDRAQRRLDDHEIMEDWQIPIMEAMAKCVNTSPGDVLEVGFGRGIGSDFIQAGNPVSHTIIECNPSVIERFDDWKTRHGDRDIRIVPGLWQDVIGGLGLFDGIFFHTYPLNEAEFVETVLQSSTFAEHFFPVAAEHLRMGGAFTYLTNEIDSLSRSHQRALWRHFSSFTMKMVNDLQVPDDTADAMWSNSMVVVRAVR